MTQQPVAPHAPASRVPIKVERIESGLQARHWSFTRDAAVAARQIILLVDGDGEAETDPETYPFSGPAILWLGDSRPGRLKTGAGATGFLASIGNAILVDAIGDEPESVGLRYMVDRNFQLPLAGQRPLRSDIVLAFEAILRELQQPQSGSPMLIAAYLRIILVSMLRISGVEELAMRSGGEKSRVLQRFRQLVEMNFRDHWTVTLYAYSLCISLFPLLSFFSSSLVFFPLSLISSPLPLAAFLFLSRSTLSFSHLPLSLPFLVPSSFSPFF